MWMFWIFTTNLIEQCCGVSSYVWGCLLHVASLQFHCKVAHFVGLVANDQESASPKTSNSIVQ